MKMCLHLGFCELLFEKQGYSKKITKFQHTHQILGTNLDIC
jgi:hypothetical protein